MLEWLRTQRGISDTALELYGVHEQPKGVAVFPYSGGAEKRRWLDDNGNRHFDFTRGFTPSLFGPEVKGGVVFLCEGETDTLRLASELFDAEVEATVLGVGGINAWRDSFAEAFKEAETVYVVLDNDPDYKTAHIVDKTWLQIRRALGPKARRVRLPEGVKDVCEFFDKYDLDTLRLLTDRTKDGSQIWHYKALDLMTEPQPPDWLVEDLVCKGDLTMMIGEPGVGKSWLTMSLAVALAEGHSNWLGRPLASDNGRVLYVDEENPERLVPYRLRKLGLSDEGAKNIRYLHRQGVRLDKAPHLILEEALDWEPALIVLDSLTRLHTKDENAAGEIASLFNDGINPLARETGATTFVLHHVNKTESNSSFTRARGSGDLSASIDSGLDVREADVVGGINVAHYKSRWIQEGTVIRAQITDTPDDHVAVIVSEKGHAF